MLKKANIGLEEKVISLLDTLYGCEECGRHGDYCECNDLDDHDDFIEDPGCLPNPPSAPSETSPSPHLPRTTSMAAPWTPPATQSCSKCGGENYGPCPDSVCFGCIPALKVRRISSSSNSPSRTPPGTPPLLRRKHHSSSNY